MSNLIVDDILFYHGGAADLGSNMEVVANFGPVRAIDQCVTVQGERNIPLTERTIQEALKALANQAKEHGANAIISLNLCPTPVYFDKMYCQVTTSGDAVLIKPKENI